MTHEVHRSSLRRLICPAQDHFIFFQLHCDVSVGYTSASVCLWFSQKNREEASTGQCAGRHKQNSELFPKVLPLRAKASEIAPRGPVVQKLDLTFDNPKDRALFQLGALSSENGNRRTFSETHYHAHSGL